MIQYDLQGNCYELGIRGDKEMNKIVNGVANDYEFPFLEKNTENYYQVMNRFIQKNLLNNYSKNSKEKIIIGMN